MAHSLKILLILLAGAGTSLAADDSSCAQRYAAMGAVSRWDGLLWRNIYPKSVSGTKAQRYQEKLVAKMKEKGFEVSETNQPTYLHGLAEQGETKVLADGPNWSYGGIYSVKRLPPARASGGPITVAWLHPEMQAAIDLVRSLGGDVVMDTSLGFTRVAAYFSTGHKTIALRPGSSWQTFQHELRLGFASEGALLDFRHKNYLLSYAESSLRGSLRRGA